MEALYNKLDQMLARTQPATTRIEESGFSENSIDKSMLWRPAAEAFREHVDFDELGDFVSVEIFGKRIFLMVKHGALRRHNQRVVLRNTERDLTLTFNGSSFLEYSYLYEPGRARRYYVIKEEQLPVKIADIKSLEIENQDGLLYSSFIPSRQGGRGVGRDLARWYRRMRTLAGGILNRD